MVKLFPADAMGPAYIKAVLAPLPQIRLAPTGGISSENAAEYLRAGATALGLAANLWTRPPSQEGIGEPYEWKLKN